MNYKEAEKIAKNMDKTVTYYDLMEDQKIRVVSIQHLDGSYIEYHSALYKDIDIDWCVVFTEHHGCHVYHKGDLQWVKEWFGPKTLYFNKDI